MADYLKNGWNWVHLCGGYIGVTFLSSIFDTHVAFLAVVVYGIDAVKEILDEISKLTNSKWMYKVGFDPAGFDLRDTIMCLIGILLGLFVLGRI